MIDEALIKLLRPLVREIVREELRREKPKAGLVSVKRAAELLGVTPAAIYSRVERKQLPSKRIGRSVYVDLDAIREHGYPGSHST